MRCEVTTSYLCYINLIDGIKIFSFKNRGILIFRHCWFLSGISSCWIKNVILEKTEVLIAMENNLYL
jgi:hypothetical protein